MSIFMFCFSFRTILIIYFPSFPVINAHLPDHVDEIWTLLGFIVAKRGALMRSKWWLTDKRFSQCYRCWRGMTENKGGKKETNLNNWGSRRRKKSSKKIENCWQEKNTIRLPILLFHLDRNIQFSEVI